MKTLFAKNISEIQNFLWENKENFLKILYIANNNCTTCHELFPKIEKISEKYDFIEIMKIMIDEVREIGGIFGVFSAPTILVFWNEKEVFRDFKYTRIADFEEKILKAKNFLEK